MQARVPGKRRFRFLQFSLRTLLLLTFLVAVACAYYLQPPSREELLAGGKLRLWRQVKVIEPGKSPQSLPPGQMFGSAVTDVQLVNHGRWTLSDENGATISTGYYQDGAQAGRWITYHPNGKKALEGKMSHGARVGVWKSWYASGQQHTETTFADQPHKRTFPEYSRPDYAVYTPYRNGTSRAWHPNGHLQFEGSCADDQQEGVWTYYDENGRMLSRGPYRAGKRHGEWTLRDDKLPARIVRYINGRTQGEIALLLEQLTRRLRAGAYAHHDIYPPIGELESLGEPAVPVLIDEVLTPSLDPRRPLAALALARMGPKASAALPQLRHLAAAGDVPDRVQLLVAIYAIDPASRDELFQPLFVQAMQEQTSPAMEAVTVMYHADPGRRSELFKRLMTYGLDSPPDVSHSVVGAIAELDDDLAPHLARHSTSGDPLVRKRVAQVLMQLRNRLLGQANLKTKTSWDDCQLLIDVLESDHDPSVKAAATVKRPAGGISGGGFF